MVDVLRAHRALKGSAVESIFGQATTGSFLFCSKFWFLNRGTFNYNTRFSHDVVKMAESGP